MLKIEFFIRALLPDLTLPLPPSLRPRSWFLISTVDSGCTASMSAYEKYSYFYWSSRKTISFTHESANSTSSWEQKAVMAFIVSCFMNHPQDCFSWRFDAAVWKERLTVSCLRSSWPKWRCSVWSLWDSYVKTLPFSSLIWEFCLFYFHFIRVLNELSLRT